MYDAMAWPIQSQQNFVICGQKHKVWVYVLLVRTRSKLSIFGEIFCFAEIVTHGASSLNDCD